MRRAAGSTRSRNAGAAQAILDAMAKPPSGTVTLLFSDIEGSTLLLRRLGDGYAELLARHRELLRDAFEQHGGYVLDTEGDAFFVAFESATEAAAAAAHAQRALAGHDWPDGAEIRVRIGLHTGELRPLDGNYVGLDVHEAARVMAAAHGGQVVFTEPTRALLDESVALRELGEHTLRDLPGEHRLYQLEIDGLPSEFPPLNTEARRSTNLPALQTAFVGRERELAEAGALLSLDEVRLLTLIGPGGAGKTRLALELAGEAIERFPGGVFFVLLTPVRDWELVMPTIARTLGLGEHPGETALETLTEHLREREVLLLLDNFEHVVPAAPALSGLLSEVPGLKVLATSRTPLRVGVERVYRVPQLADQDSLELFAERARSAAEDFELNDDNIAVVAEICARLDGLPLAIELAAPWVRTLTPPVLLRRLEQRLPLLTGGAQDADERQRTLRDTIDWSYNLLSERERTVFRRLAVFVGGFRLEAAEAVCAEGAAGADVLPVLDSLVEHSLLLPRVDSDGEPRFWMLETIREYASELLESSGEVEAILRLHADWFARLAEDLDSESRTGDQSAAVARLDADYPNLRAAIGWARDSEKGELLLRLGTALWPFWSTRGYVAEGRKALEDALELAGRRPAPALVGLASLRVFSGSSDGLLDDVHEARRAAEGLQDPLTLAQAWNLLGRVQGTLMGTLASAEEAWTRGLEYAEQGDVRAERAESIGWLMMSANFGPLPVEEGIARCRRFYDQAVDDPVIRGNARIEHGALEAMRGDFSLARQLVAEGRQMLSDLGFALLVAASAQEAFYVEMLAGDTTEAVQLMQESYEALGGMGERSYRSTAGALLAHALCARGALDEAEGYTRVSEDAAARDDVFSQVLWRAARAKIRARQDQPAEAESLAREAVARVEQTDLLNTHGDTLADLAEVLALSGRPAEAVGVLQRAVELFERKGNLTSLEKARRTAAELAG
jgi:predicted ATPase/class 3 adenylate cyclase